MYKFFLCLRYLRSRPIGFFAIIAVALCVAMMLIVTSVMNGFLDKIEIAAKGLFGDIVVEAVSPSGMAYYDEFAEEVKKKVPGVEDASPFIITIAEIRVPGSSYRQHVQVAGIRLPQRARVSDFEDGLHYQGVVKNPSFDPDFSKIIAALKSDAGDLQAIYKQEKDKDNLSWLPDTALELYRQQGRPDIADKLAAMDGDKEDLLKWLAYAARENADAQYRFSGALKYQKRIREAADKLEAARIKAGGEETEEVRKLAENLQSLTDAAEILGPQDRVIISLGLPGLSKTTSRGKIIRRFAPGNRIVLTMVPTGRGISANATPTSYTLSVIDECKTGVSPIDEAFIYVPFDTLQRLNDMSAEYDINDPTKIINPPHCNQLHIKVKDGFSDRESLDRIAKDIRECWKNFCRQHPEADQDVSIETWRVRQKRTIAPIESQRTLVIIMFGIISTVAVVLIFVIFYTIVVQKTRDIGTLKAIGASRSGVAGIFLAYGAAIGFVGAIIGTVLGWLFVRNINPIHDWVGEKFGLVVWSKEYFMFDMIPNVVSFMTAVYIVLAAIGAGLLGALVPAVRAARMQPVEALRYE